ncbi:MAG TPA: hypothetical protein VH308_11960, partial [Terracidiphilus sp.]|nr:hypothetical protein [Terracidiphilus sp.]
SFGCRPVSARTDSLSSPTLNMQAQKASDSPRRVYRGTAADLRSKLSERWLKDGDGLSAETQPISSRL